MRMTGWKLGTAGSVKASRVGGWAVAEISEITNSCSHGGGFTEISVFESFADYSRSVVQWFAVEGNVLDVASWQNGNCWQRLHAITCPTCTSSVCAASVCTVAPSSSLPLSAYLTRFRRLRPASARGGALWGMIVSLSILKADVPESLPLSASFVVPGFHPIGKSLRQDPGCHGSFHFVSLRYWTGAIDVEYFRPVGASSVGRLVCRCSVLR